MTMESAHVLELPQKMQYDAAMYSAVNGSLYRYFAVAGGAYQITSIIAAAILVYLLRRDISFKWTLLGASCLLLAFIVWLAVVSPVNSEIGGVTQQSPQMVPDTWMKLRDRWEYGHVAGFVLQLLGFCALTMSLLVETPRRRDNAA